jgi:hypothetical protein
MINRNILQNILGSIFTLNWHVSFLSSRSAAYKFIDKKNLSEELAAITDCKLQLFQCYIVIKTASSAFSQILL